MEKLNCKSLMIGDWVMYNPNVFIEDEYEPTKECYPKRISNGADIDLAIEGCYTPILLTVEIMKANGFDFMDSYINYIYDNDEVSYLEMTLNDDDEFVWTINTNEYDIMQIKYVHELQHALRLLGIEKEIVVEFEHLKKPDC